VTEDILTPFLDSAGITLYQGDCIETMRRMPEASVDAIVTDPPYGLEFMGRDWDGFGTPLGFQTWTESWAREAFRIIKPGGHLLAFAGTRTYHRMASGVEDAGFEIRDCIAWMYGSGFPKSLDVSKAIDKAAGAKPEVVGMGAAYCPYIARGEKCKGHPTANRSLSGLNIHAEQTMPATPDAAKWSGWGTALKPAFEPIVVARKPLVGTVAQNVLEHGTGALNIDGCRIGATVETWPSSRARPINSRDLHHNYTNSGGQTVETGQAPPGRWPANVTLDDEAASVLDHQSGLQKDGTTYLDNRTHHYNASSYMITDSRTGTRGYGGQGGASRFFYTVKASRKDRNTNGANNTHPTVKPTKLMQWLITLVLPPGGVLLDPFAGSGSTGVAARNLDARCILIEREDEYVDIIRQRLDDQNLFVQD
jgi:DNA modification methylase